MTWKQLEKVAAADRLKLFKTPQGVSVLTTDSFPVPLVSIQIGDLVDEDADKVLQKMTQHALKVLKELGSG